MKKFLPLICLLTFAFVNSISAQPPCLPTAGGIPAGNDAPGCTLCGPIYQGSTSGYSPSAPGSGGFPCGTIENNQFIAIIADASGTLSATILASNCQNGQGVQLIIFDQSFNPVSNCFSSGGNNLPGNVMASGLTPGQQYWIMIDGFAGDICDILITTAGGVNTGPPDPPGPMTINPDTSPLCPGAVVCYSIDPVNGASEYEWIIPGNATIVTGGGITDTEVCVEYTAPGGGVVRVTPSNPCFPGIPAIEPAVVLPILPTLKPPEFICQDDFPIVRDGNVFTEAGTHEITYKTGLGCDSVVTYIFIPNIQIPNLIDTIICAGDCVMVGFDCYDSPVPTTIRLGPPFAQANGCDSIVILRIAIFEPVAFITPPAPIGCDPGDLADLDATASSSGASVTYSWTTSNGGVLAGPSNTNFTQASAPGTYIITVSQADTSGLTCIARDTVEVIQLADPLDLPTFSSAETNVCTGSTHTYTIAPVSGAINYVWTVPAGATINGAANGTSIDVTFGSSAGSGQVCVVAEGNCGNSDPACVPVTINAIPTSDFTVASPICITDASMIIYTGTGSPFATYTWSFNGGTSPTNGVGVGPHEVSWTSPGPKTITLIVEENGCISTQTTQIVNVDAELTPPVISCTSTTTSVSFSWNSVPGATDYTVTVTPGGTTTQAGTTFDVTGLTPGDGVDITIVVNGSTACGPSTASSNCVAQNCAVVDLNIAPIASICRDASTGAVTLTANPTGGIGGGTSVWSGPGVSGNMFNPANGNVGPNVIALEYTEGTCIYTGTIEIIVNDVPDPSFTIVGPICIDELATVTYTGSASGGANFNWDFGGGTAASGAAAGPYEVDFTGAPGIQTVNLTVEENGCTSPVASQTVQVDEPLAAPQIRCAASTSTSVTIEWTVEPGITYTVNPPVGTIDMNAGTIVVDGLSPGDVVSGEIVAEGTTACGPSSMTFMCPASDCPPEPVTIDPIGPFCKDGTGAAVTLIANAGDNSGTFTFSGPGVSQPNIFDPNAAAVNPGILTIRATYQKDNCTYSGSVDVDIREQPSANFTVVDPICIRDQSTVTYTGGADASSIFTWDFGGITPVSGAGAGPYELSWMGDVAGVKDITLTVEENGCISLPNTVSITVDEPLTPPVLACDSDQNNINFTWGAVNGALSHDAVVVSSNVPGLPTMQSGPLSWNFSGLNPGDSIVLEVTANGPTECGPETGTLVCVAQNCIDYNVVMPRFDTCLYSNVTGFDLLPDLFVTNQLGDDLIDSINMVWIGPAATTYLTAGGSFFPSQAVNEIGVGNIPITVEIEYPKGSGCFKTFSSEIRLKPVPRNAIALEPNICISDLGNASLTNAVTSMDVSFDWDFGTATPQSGADGGPYELSWPIDSAGTTQDISLRVTEEGCVSDLITGSIILDAELDRLSVECDPSNTGNQSIGFFWNDVGGDDITFEVLSSNIAPLPTATSNTNTTVFFDGLTPNDDITIAVTINNTMTACPPVSDTLNCIAKSCPPTMLQIEPIVDVCIPADGAVPMQMNVTITDDPGNGAGVGSWNSDTYITSTGTFTPVNGQGDYFFEYTYSFDGCNYSTTETFRMIETPTPAFTVDPIICETDMANIVFTGDAQPLATFSWTADNNGDFGNGIDNRDPQTIAWTGAGNIGVQNITLEIDNEGCIGAPASEQVQVDPELDPIIIDCDPALSTTTGVGFVWNRDPNVTTYDITTKVGNDPEMPQGTQTNTDFGLNNLDIDGPRFITITVVANTNSLCGTVMATRDCPKVQCPIIPVVIEQNDPFCIGDPVSFISYTADFTDPSVPTTWGVGVYTFDGAGTNAVGIFDPNIAGVGTHTITVNYEEQGCIYSVTSDIRVNDLPSVEAGETQVLSCSDIEVTIGSDANPNAFSFEWINEAGDTFSTEKFPVVSEGGNYTLQVTNNATGCKNTDDVFVDGSFSNPMIDAVLGAITCFGRQDGSISINGMDGGAPPFEYSFNGSPFSSNAGPFTNLGEGTYIVMGRDANGCEDEVEFTIIEPDDITVEIVITDGENPVPFGDSIQLEAITNYAPDLLSSVSWSPVEDFPICDETNITNCLSYWVTPQGQTVYTVRIENLNGCAAEAVKPIIGIKDHPVYIPSGFSPNDANGDNDFFGLFADPNIVANIKTFLVFDRWGEVVYENFNVQPSTGKEIAPEDGWDGTFRNRTLNSGVYVYMFEVEFFDGLVEIFKGDVTIK